MKRIICTLVGIFLAASALLAQDANFARRLETAQRHYANGKYQEALSTLRVAMDRYLPDDAQKKEAEALQQKCQAQLGRFEIAEVSKNLLWQAAVDSIAVVTGNSKGVSVTTDSPTWCNVEFQNNHIRLYVTENSTHEERRALITASLGRNKKSVVVTQEAKPIVNKWVMISTYPSGANVTINDEYVSNVPVLNKLLGGRKHRFVFEKSSYQKKDTTVFIPDSDKEDTLSIMVPLMPEFARIKLSIDNPQNCEVDDPNMRVRINDRLLALDMDSEELRNYSYDDTRKVRLYHLYSDGTIPIDPGISQVTLHAKGFHDLEVMTQHLDAGVVYPVALKPIPRVGKLPIIRLNDPYYADAEGSHIFLDGKFDLGVLEDSLMVDIKVGHHYLEAKKKGFSVDRKDVDIQENVIAEDWSPLIFRQVNYSFSSSPKEATVFVNGNQLGSTTPVVYTRGADMGTNSFEVVVEKPGYLPARHAFLPNFSVPDTTIHYNFQLRPSRQVHIKTIWTSKKKDYYVTVTGKTVQGDKGFRADSVFFKKVHLPASVSLAPRQAPYYVKIYENDKGTPVFSSRFQYTGQEKDSVKTAAILNVLNFKALRANVFVLPYFSPNRPIFTLGQDPTNEFSPLGSISVGDFQIYGVSLALARSTVFWERNGNTALGIDNATFTRPHPVLPAVSVLTNLDFRTGAIIANAFQANLLASFAYYPNWWRRWMNTVSGFDLFAGVELSTLFPVFNVNVRVGYQMYRGMQANFINSSSSSLITQDFTIPDMFVVSVGFSLGSGRGERAFNFYKPF